MIKFKWHNPEQDSTEYLYDERYAEYYHPITDKWYPMSQAKFEHYIGIGEYIIEPD